MSLLTRQLFLQTQSDRLDLLRRMGAGDDSPRVKQLLAGTTNRLVQLQKQMDAEIAQAKEKASVQAPKKPKDNPLELPRQPRKQEAFAADVYLPCTDCSNTFTFSGKDQAFFQKMGWAHAPAHCPECREAKKQKPRAPAGKTLNCCDCKADFFFSDDKQRIFQEKGYAEPKRCGPCSSQNKSLVPLTLICACCSKESNFSVKAQKDFKARGWEQPKICITCRATKKAEHEAAAAAAAAAKEAEAAPVESKEA